MSPIIKIAKRRLSFIWSNTFIKGVSVLVGGTALAQAIMILILPVLTRLYSPSDFTALAIYASILGIITSIACLRLEVAIPIPENEDEAINLLVLALLSALLFGGGGGVVVWLWSAEIAALFSLPQLEPYFWLLPLGIWLSASYAALQFWATRKKYFSIIAKTRLSQAVGGASAQVGCGWIGLTPFGLLFGHMINSGAGVIGLGQAFIHDNREKLVGVRLHNIWGTLKRYSRYPKYSTIEALANNGGIQLPVLIIAALEVGTEAGFLMLATRVMSAPMGLVGGAISQVYLSQAPLERRNNRLDTFTATVLGGLFKVGAGPLVFAGAISPVAFPLIFGAEWHRAGEIVAWMTPWFIMQFLASPISMVLHVVDRQKTAFILQIVGLLLRVGTVLLAFRFFHSLTIELYAVSGFLFYVLYFFIVVKAAKIRTAKIVAELWEGKLIFMGWCFTSIIAHFLLGRI